jgi:hypothetical protein
LWAINRANVEDIDNILEDTGTTIPATITTIDNEIATIDGNVDSILEDTGTTLDGKLDTIDGNVDSILTDTGTTIPDALAAIDTDSVLDVVIDDDNTFKEVMQFVASALFGLLSGGGTDTLTFRDLGDTLNRIVATVDSSGNRTVITLTKDS